MASITVKHVTTGRDRNLRDIRIRRANATVLDTDCRISLSAKLRSRVCDRDRARAAQTKGIYEIGRIDECESENAIKVVRNRISQLLPLGLGTRN